MKIIQHGDPEKLKEIYKIKRFRCRTCDCVFEANEGEYQECESQLKHYGHPNSFYCECPECGNTNAYEVQT